MVMIAFLSLPVIANSSIYGGGEKLLYRESHFEAARERIANQQWAQALFLNLQNIIEGNVRPISKEYKNLENDSYRALCAAEYYRISGNEKYLSLIKKQLVKVYLLDKPEQKMFSTDPNHANTYYWQKMMEDWCRMLVAYDLIKNHPMFLPYKDLMESRMDEIIEEGYLYESRITRIGNTQIWGVVGLGVYGFMRGNEKAIELAINGPKGFKAILANFRDNGSFWPEPKHYCAGYVDCCLLLLSEVARNNNWKENLYEFEHPQNGASIRKMIRSLLAATTPDGFAIANGEHSEYTVVAGGKVFVERASLFSKDVVRENVKLPVYYSALKDPQVAWAMNRFPENNEYCVQLFGQSALLYGALPDDAEIEVPSAKSCVWKEMGDAVLRSDESSHYWDGEALTVHLRNGASQQYHSEDDHFSIAINAFGKNLYNHWFYRWDYLCPRKGRPNYTPFSQKILNFNTVAVDFREPDSKTIHLARSAKEYQGVDFSEIKRSGSMKVISMEGEIYKGVAEKRIIGLVDDYVLDVFTLSSADEHNYDYTLHSWGKLGVGGAGSFSSYSCINKEYGLGAIDSSSNKADNVWLSNARIADVKGTLLLDFVDSDNTAIATQVLDNAPSKVIDTATPFYLTADGWVELDCSGAPERKPMAIVRRKCANTQYIVLHQPYRPGNAIYSFCKKGELVIIKGPKFTDTVNLKTFEYARNEN